MPESNAASLPPGVVEMSDAALRTLYPDLGVGSKRLPVWELSDLLTDLGEALASHVDDGTPYNPQALTLAHFRWAHVRYMNTTQLCAESVHTNRTLSSDASLVPMPMSADEPPVGQFHGYMAELTKLSKV